MCTGGGALTRMYWQRCFEVGEDNMLTSRELCYWGRSECQNALGEPAWTSRYLNFNGIRIRQPVTFIPCIRQPVYSLHPPAASTNWSLSFLASASYFHRPVSFIPCSPTREIEPLGCMCRREGRVPTRGDLPLA